MKTFVLSILFGLVGVAWGQSETIKTIDAEVSRIDTNDKLILKEFDAGEAYDQAFDRGGTIKVYLSNNEILKIEEEIGGSMAWSQTTLYFKNGKPIKILETERAYKVMTDGTIDETKLELVFRKYLYIFNWDKGLGEVIFDGHRILTKSADSFHDYDSTIEMANKLVARK